MSKTKSQSIAAHKADMPHIYRRISTFVKLLKNAKTIFSCLKLGRAIAFEWNKKIFNSKGRCGEWVVASTHKLSYHLHSHCSSLLGEMLHVDGVLSWVKVAYMLRESNNPQYKFSI